MLLKRVFALYLVFILFLSFVTFIPVSKIYAMANPAAVYCDEQGYKLELRGPDASVGLGDAVCVFPDGSECEEWAFMRGNCGQLWNILGIGRKLLPLGLLVFSFAVVLYVRKRKSS